MARDFGEVRAQDEHDAILAVLQGVAAHEASVGAGYNQFGMNYDSDRIGFHVDVNAVGEFGTTLGSAGTPRGLLRGAFGTGGSTVGYGAVLGDRLFTALSLGYADYEPDHVYMITSPEIMTQLRTANLVDQTTVTEGNLEFQTVFGGKFRLIMTRANQGNRGGDSNVDSASTRTTFLVKPGALEMAMLDVPMPVEMFRDANTYRGSGSTDIWYRWGYVLHPMGYNWSGADGQFATNAQTDLGAGDGETPQRGGGNAYNAAGSWERRFDTLNLGILPIFHG